MISLCYLPKPKVEADNTDTINSINSHSINSHSINSAFNQFTIACELDMINAISAADIAFIMSSSQAIVN